MRGETIEESAKWDAKQYSKASITTRMKTEKEKDEIIFKLWRILDDIDTASDMFKENYEGFAKSVYRKQQERWKVLSDNDIEKLYDKYFKSPVE